MSINQSINEQRNVRTNLARELLAELAEGVPDSGSPTLVEALLADATRERATDVHLEPLSHGSAWVRFRIDGALVDVADLDPEQSSYLTNQLKIVSGLDPMPATKPSSGRWTATVEEREIDVRLSALSALSGERLTLRLLDPIRLSDSAPQVVIEAERLDPLLESLVQREGMLLVTGSTASGKTTTVYSLMDQLARQSCSIFAIEDPPEYQMDGVTQIAVDAEHGVTFAAGIRTALRMDPDYILVGEIRDEESMRAALEAASTGCIIFGTLHARDAVGVITRLRTWNVSDYELSTLLSVVVAQRLVRRLCPDCREKVAPDDHAQQWCELTRRDVPTTLWRATGCQRCHDLGYEGRTAIFETWRLEESDRIALLNHVDERQLRQSMANRGHSFLLHDALDKLSDGQIDQDEIRTMGGVGPTLDALSASKSNQSQS